VPDFDALDRDADGRLTRDELKGTAWADQIDANKDGKIDRKEFAEFFKKHPPPQNTPARRGDG
jgi:Ca2+-binding EF-hand superfamily protein